MTATCEKAVGKNWLGMQTDRVGSGAFSFFIGLCPNVFDSGK